MCAVPKCHSIFKHDVVGNCNAYLQVRRFLSCLCLFSRPNKHTESELFSNMLKFISLLNNVRKK